jgi:hypothetical protein
MKYTNTSNQSFTTTPAGQEPRIVYTADPLHDIDPGNIVRDELGCRYIVGKITIVAQIPSAVYQVVLVPLLEAAK